MAHNTYQYAGGEDAVVLNEANLLRQVGYDVHIHSISNDSIVGTLDRIRAAVNVSFSRKSFDEISNAIDRFNPDVLHVHNFFPLLTPSIHYAAKLRGLKVVQTLHNYRLICSAATFLRDGHVCELCLTGSKLNAVRYKCYRESVVGSMALVNFQNKIHASKGLIECTDRFVALTEFGRSKFIDGNIPPEKIVVKPNFVVDRVDKICQASMQNNSDDGYFLFVGRLSLEKGVHTLIDAWRSLPEKKLRIAGSGPLSDFISKNLTNNIEVLGHLSAEQIAIQMMGAQALIFPSTWYEGLPMTVIEAFSLGLPVIASNIGSLSEIITDGLNGLHFSVGEHRELAQKVELICDAKGMRTVLSDGARATYIRKYTPEANVRQLIDIYNS